MNFITANAAYSLMPFTTFEYKKNIFLKNGCSEADDDRRRLCELGWNVATVSDEERNVSHFQDRVFGKGKRSAGDRLSWKVPFEKDDGRAMNAIGDVRFTGNSFNISRGNGDGTPVVDFCILKPRIFKERYTASAEVASKARFWFFLISALEDQIGRDSRYRLVFFFSTEEVI